MLMFRKAAIGERYVYSILLMKIVLLWPEWY